MPSSLTAHRHHLHGLPLLSVNQHLQVVDVLLFIIIRGGKYFVGVLAEAVFVSLCPYFLNLVDMIDSK